MNKMDRVGADYERTIEMIRHRLEANPIPVHYPIGREEDFKGIIDLIEQKAWIFSKEGELEVIVRLLARLPGWIQMGASRGN